jgi:outer membrane immunogenic protein
MNNLAYVLVCALLSLLSLTGLAQRPANTIDAYATFSEMRANAPVGGCGCFWMSGGVGGLSVPVWGNFSAVVEVGGNITDHIPGFNTGLSLFYGMGGLRLRVANHTRFQPFGQALFGGVHGFDGYFPAPVGKLPTSYDTSYAYTLGGGVDIAVSKHVWIRAVQADYFYSELRNLQGNRQNQVRLGAGSSSEVVGNSSTNTSLLN